MIRNSLPIWIMLVYNFFCNIIIVHHFCIVFLRCYISFLLFYILNFSLFHVHMFLMNQFILLLYHHSNQCNLVNFFSKYINFLLLSLCSHFNINALFFIDSLCFSLRLSTLNLSFSSRFILFSYLSCF